MNVKELVKDRVIKYLIEDLLVPQDMIDTNVELAEFEEGAEGILDIVVNVKDEEDYYAPVMIVQCLDEDVELEGEVLQKQIEFLEEVDNITMSGRLVLTNGDAMMYADWRGEEYDTEAALPTYDIMVKEFHEMEQQVKDLEEHHHHDENCGCGCNHHHEN
ncbi:type I restriction enzyme HsdR N-terminal domain-containing protein [Clostridioides difficile]|nr:type I restriction enzyme HsdR N-terminal domain-containing protein [Clostridioides difficile]